MAAILTLNYTVYGQQLQNLSLPIGSSVLWTFLVQDPITRATIDLTTAGTVVTSSLTPLDARGQPTYPPVISRLATITGSPANQCTLAWAYSDTVPSGTPIASGIYAFDVWVTDSSGNRKQALATSYVKMTSAATLPGQSVTPLPSQPSTMASPIFRWNLTKTWAQVWAEVLIVANGGIPQGIILVDSDDLGTQRQVTVGTYQFRNITFRGINAAASPAYQPTINLASGVLLDNSTGWAYLDAEAVNFQANAAITRAGDSVNISFRYGAALAGVVSTFPQVSYISVSLERSAVLNGSYDPLGLPVAGLVDFASGGAGFASVGVVTGSRIGAGAFGGAIVGTVTMSLDATTTNITTYPVSAWITGSAVFQSAVGQGSSLPPRVKYRTSDGAIVANTFIKFSATTDYRVIQAGTGDTRDNVSGVALDGAAGAGTLIRVVEERGQQVDVKTDGSGGGNIARGSLVDLSSATAGYCKIGAGSAVGRVIKQAVNSANTLVRIVF